MKHKQGYFLLELSIVLALFVLLIITVTTTTTFFNRVTAHTQLNELRALCHYLHYYAQTSGVQQAILIDIATNTYQWNNETYRLPRSLAFGYLPAIKGPPGAPTAQITQPITFMHHTILFYPSGIVSSGTLYITDQERTIQYALSNAIGAVSQLRLYKYEKEWIKI